LNCKGNITCTSVLNEGTIFCVQLPVNNQQQVNNVENAYPTVPAYVHNHQNNIRPLQQPTPALILIAEDSEDMRHFIVSNLPDRYKIIETTNGADCFDKANKLMPDLIISDVMMPVMDGLELTSKIKEDENTSHIPIILLTAKATHESKMTGLLNKADDYITKPFSIAELKVRIENILASRKRLKEKFSRNITINPSEITTTSLDEKFLCEALQVVEDNMDNAEFEAEDFCHQIGISRAHVYRKLKSLTDPVCNPVYKNHPLKKSHAAYSAKSWFDIRGCLSNRFQQPVVFQ
jgi:DNA-binding response OmpR family regulator